MGNIDKKIEVEIIKTMASLDHLERVEGTPYLYTQIQDRLVEGKTGIAKVQVLIYALVALLLCVNIFTVANRFNTFEQDIGKNVAKEFGINTELIANTEDY